ncbi:MAG: 3-deoxy-manno-octulosonate cytidylyltransferase [Bacteroidota bacterium]
MKIIGIIPARFASTRFPGKPLVEINGKSMIQRVYEQAKKSSSLSDVIVATDDQRIYDHVNGFGGKVIMTSELHSTGTDRCHEVVMALEKEKLFYDVAINIQGDEPYINPEQINLLAACFKNERITIATLIKKLEDSEALFSPNTIKVIKDYLNKAVYFSRTAIPFMRDKNRETWLQFHTYYKHIGIYAYRIGTLKEISALAAGNLEIAESLEQLRWLENAYEIFVVETNFESHSVDVREDLLKFDSVVED